MTMMIQAIRLTRKKAALAVILAGAVLAALILLLGQHGGNVGASEQPCLSSNGERVAYLRELGWEIDSEPLTTLQFLLPPKLSGDYITYNDLQKSQGFDLETCCGKQVTRYTYTVTNYPSGPTAFSSTSTSVRISRWRGTWSAPGPTDFRTHWFSHSKRMPPDS